VTDGAVKPKCPLPPLADGLSRIVTLSLPWSAFSCPETDLRVDHFSGGRSFSLL
jgi:hypothetical protein